MGLVQASEVNQFHKLPYDDPLTIFHGAKNGAQRLCGFIYAGNSRFKRNLHGTPGLTPLWFYLF